MERRVAQIGHTPLHMAAMHDEKAVIKALLAAEADVNAKDEVRGEGGLEGEGGAAWVLWLTVVV